MQSCYQNVSLIKSKYKNIGRMQSCHQNVSLIQSQYQNVGKMQSQYQNGDRVQLQYQNYVFLLINGTKDFDKEIFQNWFLLL